MGAGVLGWDVGGESSMLGWGYALGLKGWVVLVVG